jgi:hypothetical protein
MYSTHPCSGWMRGLLPSLAWYGFNPKMADCRDPDLRTFIPKSDAILVKGKRFGISHLIPRTDSETGNRENSFTTTHQSYSVKPTMTEGGNKSSDFSLPYSLHSLQHITFLAFPIIFSFTLNIEYALSELDSLHHGQQPISRPFPLLAPSSSPLAGERMDQRPLRGGVQSNDQDLPLGLSVESGRLPVGEYLLGVRLLNRSPALEVHGPADPPSLRVR